MELLIAMGWVVGMLVGGIILSLLWLASEE